MGSKGLWRRLARRKGPEERVVIAEAIDFSSRTQFMSNQHDSKITPESSALMEGREEEEECLERLLDKEGDTARQYSDILGLALCAQRSPGREEISENQGILSCHDLATDEKHGDELKQEEPDEEPCMEWISKEPCMERNLRDGDEAQRDIDLHDGHDLHRNHNHPHIKAIASIDEARFRTNVDGLHDPFFMAPTPVRRRFCKRSPTKSSMPSLCVPNLQSSTHQVEGNFKEEDEDIVELMTRMRAASPKSVLDIALNISNSEFKEQCTHCGFCGITACIVQ